MTAKGKFIGILLLSLVLLDQATKFVIDRTFPLHHSIPVIEGFFSLTYIRNTGAAFGIFSGSHESFRRPILILFSLLAIGFILRLLWRMPKTEKGLITALTLILGGAIGNLVDRVLYGEVIDFLDFYWSSFHWPAFNFADSFITIGVVITFFRLMIAKGNDPFVSPSES